MFHVALFFIDLFFWEIWINIQRFIFWIKIKLSIYSMYILTNKRQLIRLAAAEQAKSESINFDLSIHPSICHVFFWRDNSRTVWDRALKFEPKINLGELKSCIVFGHPPPHRTFPNGGMNIGKNHISLKNSTVKLEVFTKNQLYVI